MKEMIYQAEFKREVLDTGYCLGLLYFILNLGSHPTAYIKIPENSKYYGKDMGEIDLNVHEGVTYVNDYLYISANQKIDGWFIGWDYAHYGDYAGYEKLLPQEFRTGGKKWSTQEIYQEVREACYEIQNKKEEVKNGNKE